MQVDLDGRWRPGDGEEPATLLLFDLNGFKRYNDTFGHPAGDELLARLGTPAARRDRGRRRPPTGSAATSSAVLLDCAEGRCREVARAAPPKR